MIRLLAAAAFAVPVAAIVGFEILYLTFGVTGREVGPAYELAAFVAPLVGALIWSLHRARGPREAALRGCALGMGAAISLPVVAVAVAWIWEAADDRPELGMGGMMFYAAPFVAFGLAVVLVAVLWLIQWLLTRRRRPGRQPRPLHSRE